MKNQKGVTLIILTVTITVILILVGATIGTLVDDKEITEQARNLEERTKEKQKKNEEKLAELMETLDSIIASKSLQNVMVIQDGVETWNNGKATIKLMVTENGIETQDYKIEYIKGYYDGVWTTYTGPITDLENETPISCRVVKNNEILAWNTINVLDLEEPRAVITFDVNTTNAGISAVTVEHLDDETGINIEECMWELTNSDIPILENMNMEYLFTHTFETNNQKISLAGLDSTKIWYLHVLSVDNAGNEKETIKGPIKFEIVTRTIQDTKGNSIVIPGGFELATDSGSTVEQGIVIEDNAGNQFVWIPVSNIDGSNDNPIIKDDGSKAIITLGRYTFDGEYDYDYGTAEGTGLPVLVQNASNYQSETEITVDSSTYKELKDYRESKAESDSIDTNTSAQNIVEFIKSVRENKGFYIARYEASYGEGYNELGYSTVQQFKNAKPLSQKSKAFSNNVMNYTKGTLWNFINQPAAAKVSQNMYNDSDTVKSDLINSYAWDTTLAFIQKMKNNGYANQVDGNGNLKNTGETQDEVCKIFDIAGNIMEWTTEYCVVDDYNYYPCTARGGYAEENYFSAKHRLKAGKTDTMENCGFRPIIYVK